MLAHRDLLILTLGVMILIGCGQQILKDEGLDSKSIGEAASSSEFKVDIVDPSDGETNVSTSSNISFTFNKELYNYGAGSSNDCDDQLFQLSTNSNFTTCVGWNSSCSGFSTFYKVTNNNKTITLCTTSLNSSTTYYLKVVADSNGGGGSSLSSTDGTKITEFKSNFTTQ